MPNTCHACGFEINDSFYWKVNGVSGVENWCAECHADERGGMNDPLIWRDEEECDNDGQDISATKEEMQ